MPDRIGRNKLHEQLSVNASFASIMQEKAAYCNKQQLEYLDSLKRRAGADAFTDTR